jgi:CheY-like chemotaxis protein
MKSLAGIRILIVEDDADTREMYAVFLRHMGMLVETAADGARALEQVSGFSPDVIVMDIGLPIMTGDEAATLLRAGADTKDIPIIALSGFGLIPPPRMEQARFDVFCRKPCLPVDLAAVIRSTLDQARAMR